MTDAQSDQERVRRVLGAEAPGERVFSAFGHALRSTIDFPELRPTDPAAPIRWEFGLMDEGEPSEGGELLGAEPLYGDVAARLFRHADGRLRIEVDDTGVYDLGRDGSTILWRPNSDPWWDFGRGHLLGRVLSTSMHFDGLLVLHGSAVETGEGTIAFLGVKGSGKTTLALSMIGEGARLVTDDTLPVVPSERLAWPGVQSLRLSPSAAMLRTPDGSNLPGRDGKIVTAPLEESTIATRPTELRAIYIVEPAVSRDPDRTVARATLDPLRATAALAAHTKIGTMLGRDEATTLLDRAAQVASRVPVNVLAVHRDRDRLGDVTGTILDWHCGPAGG